MAVQNYAIDFFKLQKKKLNFQLDNIMMIGNLINKIIYIGMLIMCNWNNGNLISNEATLAFVSIWAN